MNDFEPTRTPNPGARSTIFVALHIVSAALMGATAAGIDSFPGLPSLTVAGVDSDQTTIEDFGPPTWATPPGEADGIVPNDVTVFDDQYPAVVNLDPELLTALRRAATDAADEGVVLYVNSGWRSAEYQNQLLQEAISKYGSEAEAGRWVATAENSLHVSGDAVDIGRVDATAWLSEHGAGYGLCQIYSNEPWHFELRPEAIVDGCPPMYADPTHDPRMQK